MSVYECAIERERERTLFVSIMVNVLVCESMADPPFIVAFVDKRLE